ncbi:MAG: cob(I)yrinic acid a,c-diamide adenosyltransferase [Flavobacteriales bacterium]
MKIYTRKGDSGTTSLLGGTRVPKHHLRIEAYGTVDELNSYLGLVRDTIAMSETERVLEGIQERLFTMGSHLAVDPEHAGKMKLPELAPSDILFLEEEMDKMDARLPEMKHFILPGGHVAASHCHVARCICRRAERCLTSLNEYEPLEPILMQYLNRLSDYLFVLSRWVAQEKGAIETPWIPRQ